MSSRAETIAALEQRERATRRVVLGGALAFYAAAWLLLAFRASRIAETECSVVRLPNGYCTVSHVENGDEHTLPWDDCAKPTRWPSPPGPAQVGMELHCFYYRNFPDSIFFERRRHAWLGPVPVAVLGLGTALLFDGLRRRRRARAKPAGLPRDPYRETGAPAPEPRPPLEVPLSASGGLNWILGGPFLVLGLVLAVLTSYLAWTTGGEFGFGMFMLLAVGQGVPLAGAFLGLYRSGLVFDTNAGTVAHWWGLSGRWFTRSRDLAGLVRATAERHPGARSATHYLVLEFSEGKPWKYTRSSREAAGESERINAHLAESRAQGT